MAKPKVLPASEAVALIPDGAIVTVSSSSALGCPDAVLEALGARFDREGHPRNLTTLHPIAAGDMWGVKGIDHIAKAGCRRRFWPARTPRVPPQRPPLIWRMIRENAIPAYNVPSGILFDMHREAAAKWLARYEVGSKTTNEAPKKKKTIAVQASVPRAGLMMMPATLCSRSERSTCACRSGSSLVLARIGVKPSL